MPKQEIMTNADAGLGAKVPGGELASNESLAVMLHKAEFDQAALWAQTHPRVFSVIQANIRDLATLDDETAEECIYSLPRAGKEIEGPSIRLAEIIFSQWGHCRISARVVHVDRAEKFIEAEAVFTDLVSGAQTVARRRQRAVDKNGKLYNDDMLVVTGNAAAAIAKRNAILAGIPKPIWRRAYQSVEAVLAGDDRPMAERRERALASFAKYNVGPERVLQALGVKSQDDLTSDHLVTLTGMRSALKNGEATLDEMFPPVSGVAQAQGLQGRMDALAAGKTDNQNDPAGSGPAVGAEKATDAARAAGEQQAGGSGVATEPGRSPAAETDGAAKAAASGAAAPGGEATGENKATVAASGSPAATQADGNSGPGKGEAKATQAKKKPETKASGKESATGGDKTPATDKATAGPDQKTPAPTGSPQGSPSTGLTNDDRNMLRTYHQTLGGSLSVRSLEQGSGNFVQDHPRLSEHPALEAITREIYGMHRERVTGLKADGSPSEISIADIDNRTRQLLA